MLFCAVININGEWCWNFKNKTHQINCAIKDIDFFHCYNISSLDLWYITDISFSENKFFAVHFILVIFCIVLSKFDIWYSFFLVVARYYFSTGFQTTSICLNFFFTVPFYDFRFDIFVFENFVKVAIHLDTTTWILAC